MSVFVKGPGNVHHDGKVYEVGDAIEDISPEQEKSLLQAGAVQTQPLEAGRSEIVVPTEEEVAATAEAVGNAQTEVR